MKPSVQKSKKSNLKHSKGQTKSQTRMDDIHGEPPTMQEISKMFLDRFLFDMGLAPNIINTQQVLNQLNPFNKDNISNNINNNTELNGSFVNNNDNPVNKSGLNSEHPFQMESCINNVVLDKVLQNVSSNAAQACYSTLSQIMSSFSSFNRSNTSTISGQGYTEENLAKGHNDFVTYSSNQEYPPESPTRDKIREVEVSDFNPPPTRN